VLIVYVRMSGKRTVVTRKMANVTSYTSISLENVTEGMTFATGSTFTSSQDESSALSTMVISGRGNITVTAQGGDYAFVLAPDIGHITINDFVPGSDLLNLSAFHIASFAALHAATTDTPGGANIHLGTNSDLTLPGVHASTLGPHNVVLS
jgi:hypothetical protein